MNNIKFVSSGKIYGKLPETPGVYFLCEESKKPLYIGKAKVLRERINTHFKNPSFLLGKEIQNIKKIGYVETSSEIEALLLESRMIKKYRPKYNIVGRDNKQFFYVGITNEQFPRIFITHQKIQNAKFPAQGGSASGGKIQNDNEKLKILYLGPFIDGKSLKLVLKLLRRIFPYYTKKHGKLPCFYCHLDLCPGPNVNPKKYQKNIKKLIEVLRGKRKTVLKNLKKEMAAAAKSENFEKAAKIRNQIKAFENIFEHAALRNPFGTETQFANVTRKDLAILTKRYLKLPKAPKRIEAYDISNIQGNFAVGSMITFRNGAPDKNYYRRFKIRISGKPRAKTKALTRGKADDTAMIKEILERRLGHSEWPYPDLILIDGGIAQLNVAKLTIKQLNNLTIPAVALAKKENKLYTEDRTSPILLKNLPREISNLILYLRDEAHRFAIGYYRKIHRKSVMF